MNQSRRESSSIVEHDGFGHYNDTDINTALLAFGITIFSLMPLHIGVNLLILVTVYVFNSMRTIQNILRASSSFNGLLAGLTLNPTYALLWLPKDVAYIDRSNKYACISFLVPAILTGTAAFTNMTIISADRFFAVVYPIKYRAIMSVRKAWHIIIAVWAYCTAFALSQYAWNEYRPGECTFFRTQSKLGIFLGFPVFALCLLISTVFNGAVLFKAFKIKQQSKKSPRSQNNTTFSLLLHLTYLILWVPYLASVPAYSSEKTKSAVIFHIVAAALSNLYFSSSSLIYITLQKQARVAIKCLLKTPPWKWSELNEKAIVNELKIMETTLTSPVSIQSPDGITSPLRGPSTGGIKSDLGSNLVVERTVSSTLQDSGPKKVNPPTLAGLRSCEASIFNVDATTGSDVTISGRDVITGRQSAVDSVVGHTEVELLGENRSSRNSGKSFRSLVSNVSEGKKTLLDLPISRRTQTTRTIEHSANDPKKQNISSTCVESLR